MAPRNERDELLAAWRALAGNTEAEGWRTIPVAIGGPCQLHAGRHFPGNEEALLVRFAPARIPPADQFPQGRGFRVSRANFGDDGAAGVWVALCRQSAGSLDLFTMMAVDIVATLEAHRSCNDEKLILAFLSRIRAWQEFMRRSEDGLLSLEAEVGLFGELEFLGELLTAGLPSAVAVAAWQGPLDGIQDFTLGTGAIEVKSTASPNAFTPTVTSLEQLDESLIRPLFLACVRLALDSAGRTLPDIVNDTRGLLAEEPAALAGFDNLLLRAGYLDAFADRFTRRFSRVDVRLLTVNDDFPRLTRSNVAIGIVKARYDIDLDLVPARNIGLADALRHLGAM